MLPSTPFIYPPPMLLRFPGGCKGGRGWDGDPPHAPYPSGAGGGGGGPPDEGRGEEPSGEAVQPVCCTADRNDPQLPDKDGQVPSQDP